jgi:Flp pilus assembly protein TadG
MVRQRITWLGAAARGLCRRIVSDGRAVAAIEFALIAPILISLYFGAVELGDALIISRKVTHVTSSLTDLVTQSKTIVNSDMKNIFDAATAVITPYSATNLKMIVSEISIDATSNATIVWSDARGTGAVAYTVGTPVTNLPSGVTTASTYVVSTEVHYSYKPLIGYIMTGTFDLHDQFYLRPRLSASIARSP